jgi:tetratricopeptide (TPR) repeat protein
MAGGAQVYYQALCLRKVGQEDKAKPLFQSLIDGSRNAQPAGRGGGGGFGRSQSARARDAATHYSTALGYLGLNDRVKAKDELRQAVTLSPDLLAARQMLGSLD